MAPEFTSKFQTLIEILEASTEKFRDRPLFGVKRDASWSWMSYGSFRDEVDRVRTGLGGLGISKGDSVAIISDNRPEWAIAAYGAYGLGAKVVPMYEAQHDEEWEYILGDSGAMVALVANEGLRTRVLAFADQLPALEAVIAFDANVDAGALTFADLGTDAATVPLADVKPHDIAGFVYTSGTTGKPKGVLLSHANLAYNVSAITDVFPLVPDDRTLSFLPWAHAFGQTEGAAQNFGQGAAGTCI